MGKNTNIFLNLVELNVKTPHVDFKRVHRFWLNACLLQGVVVKWQNRQNMYFQLILLSLFSKAI